MRVPVEDFSGIAGSEWVDDVWAEELPPLGRGGVGVERGGLVVVVGSFRGGRVRELSPPLG